MIKKAMIFLWLLLLVTPSVCRAEGRTEDGPLLPTPEEVIGEVDLDKVNTVTRALDREVREALPDLEFSQLVRSLIKGDLGTSPAELVGVLYRYLFKELAGNAVLLGKLVILAVICAVLNNVSSAFEKATASKVAQSAVYLVLVTLAISSFVVALDAGREAVNGMVNFMHAILPVMVVLLCALGSFATAALFHPAVLMVVNFAGTIIATVVFPLLFFSAVLGMASHLAEGFSLSRLADFLKWVGLGIMGLLTSIFLGILSIHGVAGAVTEGLAYRTAKLATSTFIPVVGKVFADTMDAISGSSLLVKNGVGMAGLLVVFLIAIFPLLKILGLVVIYKLAAALVQPLGENRLADLMNTLGNNMVAVFAVVATCGILFFFALAIVTGIGSINVMLR